MALTRTPVELPTFTPAERAALRDFHAVWEANYDEIQAAVAVTLQAHPAVAASLRGAPQDQIEKQGLVTRERLRKGIVEGDVGEYVEDLRQSGRRLANAGVDLATWIDLTSTSKRAAIPHIFKAYGHSPERVEACIQALSRWADMALSVLSDEFIATKESLIAKQSAAIIELSTPVLEIRGERLIVPIIGVVDSHRARLITDSVLAAVREHKAKVLILDITAVSAMDTLVASHLTQMVEAARLMGVETLITGVSTQVAHALVSLGIELGNVQTLASLRTGSEAADLIQGMAFVPRKELRALREANERARAPPKPPLASPSGEAPEG